MISINEMQGLLDEIIDSFPKGLFKELNGGVLLLPETKRNPINPKKLYILGQYHRHQVKGRYITLYYGSIKKIHGHLSCEALEEKLIKLLKHELRHHVESLAGDRSLEKEDEAFLKKYR